MAMKKADMEAHRAKYHALMSEARLAERAGLYRKAIESALASWDHIDGMIQFERKYEGKGFASIPTVEIILRYAPLLLDFQSLDALEILLKNFRRIERDTSDSLADKLARARARMWDNHRLWDHLERHPDIRQNELRRVLGGDQAQWRSVADAWEKMGLLRRTPEGGSYRVALSTRLGEPVPAKCPSCGEVVKAPKAIFLEKTACPECREDVLFVILSREVAYDAKE